MRKELEKKIDEFFNSIPRNNLTDEEYKEIQKKNREEDIEFYSNRDEKGYLIQK